MYFYDSVAQMRGWSHLVQQTAKICSSELNSFVVFALLHCISKMNPVSENFLLWFRTAQKRKVFPEKFKAHCLFKIAGKQLLVKLEFFGEIITWIKVAAVKIKINKNVKTPLQSVYP